MTGPSVSRRATVVRGLLVGGAAVFLLTIGVAPIWAAAGALVVVAAIAAWNGLPLHPGPATRRRRRPAEGARSDLARLAADLRGTEVQHAATERMRVLAGRRFARLERNGADPRLSALLGDAPRLRTSALPGMLDALDGLGDREVETR